MPAIPTAPGRKPGHTGSDAPEEVPRLAHLPARDKLERLLQVAKGHRKVLLLTHDNPDPDSIAAAVAMGHGLEPSVEVATALFYGIKADTRDLGRETTQTDIDSYLWLFPRIDKLALAQIEHPVLPARYFQLYHTAIERAKVYGTAIVTDLGEV